jgi:hypothetical protein
MAVEPFSGVNDASPQRLPMSADAGKSLVSASGDPLTLPMHVPCMNN